MKHLKEVCIVGNADNTNNSPLIESDATVRLQQAAHILVTGAIRAAQKQKTNIKKSIESPTVSLDLPMSGFQTSGEIGCKTSHELPVNRTHKKAHFNRWAEGEKAKGQ